MLIAQNTNSITINGANVTTVLVENTAHDSNVYSIEANCCNILVLSGDIFINNKKYTTNNIIYKSQFANAASILLEPTANIAILYRT